MKFSFGALLALVSMACVSKEAASSYSSVGKSFVGKSCIVDFSFLGGRYLKDLDDVIRQGIEGLRDNGYEAYSSMTGLFEKSLESDKDISLEKAEAKYPFRHSLGVLDFKFDYYTPSESSCPTSQKAFGVVVYADASTLKRFQAFRAYQNFGVGNNIENIVKRNTFKAYRCVRERPDRVEVAKALLESVNEVTRSKVPSCEDWWKNNESDIKYEIKEVEKLSAADWETVLQCHDRLESISFNAFTLDTDSPNSHLVLHAYYPEQYFELSKDGSLKMPQAGGDVTLHTALKLSGLEATAYFAKWSKLMQTFLPVDYNDPYLGGAALECRSTIEMR